MVGFQNLRSCHQFVITDYERGYPNPSPGLEKVKGAKRKEIGGNTIWNR